MNSCRKRPLEVIAADMHKVDYSCCLVTEATSARARAKCPASDTLSWKVQHRTVESLVRPEKRHLVAQTQYYYCADADCHIVYFADGNFPPITRDNVAVTVFSKDTGEDVNVCYCYGWTRERIRKEIEETGKSTVALSIAMEMKSVGCNCDVKNPKGECCMGDVHTVVQKFLLEKRD